METQNITLAIPREILRKAKLIAVHRQSSVSGLLTELLTELVAKTDRYEKAKGWHLAWLKKAPDLGTRGKIRWTRDQLHER